jgi:predicted Zn-ribbon and HTH transcriptional regulator
MASESTDEGAVTVELPPGLDEWLSERASELDEPREVIVRQLLASYQTTAELDESTSPAELFDIDGAVEDAMGDKLDAAVGAAIDSRLDDTVRDRLPDITDAVEGRLDDRLDAIEEDFQGKITDVRERVVQLKREIDTKAPADHEAFDAVDELDEELAALNRELVEVRDETEDGLADQSARVDDIEEHMEDIEERLSDTEDKLRRVAWVVNDLRDDQGGRDANQKAVDRIKRAAAQEGISTASCQSCGDSVDIGLLTDPRCPHCNSTVSDVRPEGGIIRKKATLTTASQLEAGPSDE